MIRICFVCLGNICRSPTAHGIMEHLVREAGLQGRIEVEGAGTGGYHVGEPPDARAQETARRRGFALPGTAQHFQARDYVRFDYVVAMDRSNHRHLQGLAKGAEELAKLHMLRAFDPGSPDDAEVPDPYYGGPQGFENVFDICEAGCRGLLERVRQEHGL